MKNVLLIMTDEQRFDFLGSVNPAIKTPNLDALAVEGVLFTRAYTSNPSCVPARAALYTGKYPHQCSCPTYVTHLPEHEVTFMSLLRSAGYHTAVVGKQHFGESRIDRGYDYEDIVDSHIPFGSLKGREDNSYDRWLRTEGFSERRQLIDLSAGPRLYAEWKTEPKYHIDNYIGDRGRDWVEQLMPRGGPWFCSIGFAGPHMPIDCGSFPEAGLYDPANLYMPKTDYTMLETKPPHNAMAHGEPPPRYEAATDEEIRLLRRAYCANVTLIDRKIGEILDALRDAGVYDETLIIFTTDHGDYLGDFGLSGKGQNIHEVLMRIPLIVKPPSGGVADKRESSLVSSVDIAATCLVAAGADVPANMASRDLSEYWAAAEDQDNRELLYMEAGGIRCVRDRRWKYCHYQGREYGELYDLQTDPWETKNLWEAAKYSDLKCRLRGDLVDKLIELSPRAGDPWNRGAPVI